MNVITWPWWKVAQSFQAPGANVLRWPLSAPYLCSTIYSTKHMYAVHRQAESLFTGHTYGFNRQSMLSHHNKASENAKLLSEESELFGDSS